MNPDLIVVEAEPDTFEPECVIIEQELSCSATVGLTDTAIKSEQTDNGPPLLSAEDKPITEADLSTIVQKPFDNQDFSFEDLCYKSQKPIRPYITKAQYKHHCDICSKRYRLRENLDNHRRAHTGALLKCDFCNKGFVRKSLLIRHMRTHTQEKPYKCNLCTKQFTQRGSLQRHEQIHSGTKFVCDICKGEFAYASYLKLHARIHTQEKPYSCEVCKKAFPYSASLKRHRLTQHKTEKATAKKKNRK